MKDTPNLQAEKYRVRDGMMASSRFDGNNGAFIVPFGPPEATQKRVYAYVIVSDQLKWDHVSVSVGEMHRGEFRALPRCPTWEEMDHIKRLFWRDDECVVQYHVPRTDHISDHNTVLHMWSAQDQPFPLPAPIMVGLGVGEKKLATMSPEQLEDAVRDAAREQLSTTP